MEKYSGEKVLVVPRAIFLELGIFEGLRKERLDSAVNILLDPDNHFFMDRAAAEMDSGFKQLIPYCIFCCGNRVLYYTRGKSGGEDRLHAKISIGVGGHVNPIDMGEGRKGADAYHAAVTREIEEELNLQQAHTHRIVALVNDESTAVGEVHLGIVHVVNLASEAVTSREDALAELGFASIDELNGPLFERLETWSQSCVRDLLAGQKFLASGAD